MNRIEELFKSRTSKVLSVYCTAGFPAMDDTLTVLKALQENGVAMIELGMPYSDPLADGQVIQHSSTIALQNGMTIKKLFDQLRNFRKDISVPVLLMGYMNPILQYGFEKFCSDASTVGIDGLILPDLPEYEYETEYAVLIKKYGLDFVFLVTPETSEDRIRKLDRLSSGFLYAVSSSSTTGRDKDMSNVQTYLQRLAKLKLRNPIIVGFGIKDKQTFEAACVNASGAIIGTAFVKALDNTKDVRGATKKFIQSVLQ